MGIIRFLTDTISMLSNHKQGDTKDKASNNYSKDILVTDFQQCMYMLRHYDTINWDLTKFAFGQMLVVIGACWTVLNSNKAENQTIIDVYSDGISNYIIGVIMILSALFMVIVLAAIIKNRKYFVLMSRYLNEHRDLALRNNELGFENKAEMWHSYNFPDIIDLSSTQLYCFYLLSILFLGLSWFGIFSLLFYYDCRCCVASFVILLIICCGICRLSAINNK